MSASLVGSEMCIRDRLCSVHAQEEAPRRQRSCADHRAAQGPQEWRSALQPTSHHRCAGEDAQREHTCRAHRRA
eukprot:4776395-Alexandrium_andersonii.AAC.1